MKKFYFYICLYSVLIITYSCGMGKENIVVEYNPIGKSIKLDSTIVGQSPILMFGDNFIFRDWMHVHGNANMGGKLSGDTLSLSENLLNVGHGHNEFQNVSFVKGQDNTLYLLNRPGFMPQSVTCITRPNSLDDVKATEKWKRFSLRDLPPLYSLPDYNVSISDSTILIIGAPTTCMGHIMSILDFKNQKVQPLDFWPQDNVECDSTAKYMLYAQYAKIIGNGNGRYAYMFAGGRYLFVFSIEGNHVNVIKTLYEIYPMYEGRGKNWVSKGTRRPEGIQCDGSSENLYVLLTDSDKDGKKLYEDKGALYGNTIEVYDWDGNIQKIIHLDKYGTRIMVSDDNNTLYLFVLDYDSDIYEVWSYDLNSLK